jgi:hypothetical protein
MLLLQRVEVMLEIGMVMRVRVTMTAVDCDGVTQL